MVKTSKQISYFIDYPILFGLKTFENDLIFCTTDRIVIVFTSKRNVRLKMVFEYIRFTKINLFPTVINAIIEDYCGEYKYKEWIEDWLMRQKINFTILETS
jgi:hypothetical protein